MAMLHQHRDILEITTQGPGFTRLGARINSVIATRGLDQGLCVALALHTSCSLTINENADPRVLADLEAYLRALVPPEGVRPISGSGDLRPYRHDDEGPDDMPAHIRTALTATSLSLPIAGGQLLLGTWQEVYLWEHRDAHQRRRIALHLIGS
jgi:secondary thiamine-phosphate synthase enzyme